MKPTRKSRETQTHRQFEEVHSEIGRQFDEVHARIDRLHFKLDKVAEKIESILEAKLVTKLDARFSKFTT